MIIDLQRFVKGERPHWQELERQLNRLEADPDFRMSLQEVQQFHHLYERAAADLAKLQTFASEPELRQYLESLVARAYADIHETRERERRWTFRQWLTETFPGTFRKHVRAFWLSVVITMVGVVFGMGAIAFDPESKEVIMPFSHLMGDPSERVAKEEAAVDDRLEGQKSTFAGHLMTHNTKVSIFAMALGMTWAVGTIVLLFYNGIILGAVVLDYVRAGESVFLAGWLLPHGSIEIPAILIAGQAGLVLGGALIGWGKRSGLRERMREIGPDLATLIGGVGLMLIWAGIIEAFLSQYHEPVIPYALKIAFGLIELCLLFYYLARSGQKKLKAGDAR